MKRQIEVKFKKFSTLEKFFKMLKILYTINSDFKKEGTRKQQYKSFKQKIKCKMHL